MKAWILDAVHTPLRLADVEVPTPGPGQVAVKVRATGLCHSDVGYMEGVIPFSTDLPLILGHEAAGTISAVGEGVTGWQVGDAVVGAIHSTDAPGVTHDGAYAEYILLTADLLVKLPDGIDWGQAAAATDAGVTSYTGVVVHGEVKAGDRVGIIGLGGLGMTGARIAVIKGATVYGVEPKESSWETAREQGVTEVFKDVSELEGMDLDAVIDFAGFGTTTTGALKAVKPGGRVSQVGLGKTEFTFNSYDLIARAVTLQGSTPQGKPEHLQDVIDMVASGDLVIRAEEIGFDAIPEGLERLQRGEVTGRLYATLPE
jgi:alcohol dehydrogenase, propanol-preferring